jgi:single-strand DNA-binding protein
VKHPSPAGTLNCHRNRQHARWWCRPCYDLRVAVAQRIQQDGEWRDGDTSFLRVNVWRSQAEHLADSLSKGDRVMVTGRLRQRSWETPDGDKRSVTEVEADEVGASLKWATAKVERAQSRGNGDRAQGRRRQAERGDFNDQPPLLTTHPRGALGSVGAPGLSGTFVLSGGLLHERPVRSEV